MNDQEKDVTLHIDFDIPSTSAQKPRKPEARKKQIPQRKPAVKAVPKEPPLRTVKEEPLRTTTVSKEKHEQEDGLKLFKNKSDLVRAVIMKEILDPPKGMR